MVFIDKSVHELVIGDLFQVAIDIIKVMDGWDGNVLVPIIIIIIIISIIYLLLLLRALWTKKGIYENNWPWARKKT